MMKLLVADDEIIVRSFVKAVLEKEKLPVSELLAAADGAEAVDLCRRHRPEAVLMDLRMPAMGGLAAISIIVRELPETYITVISAHAEFSLVRQAFQLGVKDYLLKPMGAKELAGHILKMVQAPGLPSASKPAGEDKLVRAVARFTDEHMSQSFTAFELARTLYISPAHLSRKFKKLTGQSLGAFIQARRLARAAELLIHSGLSVTEVAAEVGFDNPGYFATYFKAHTGRSPSAFRRQGPGGEADASDL